MSESAQPLLSMWFVGPVGLLMLAVIAGHAWVMAHEDDEVMPPSRRRIRTVTAVIGGVWVPMLVFGAGVVTPAERHLFALTWLANLGLLFIVVMLAGIDMVNNWRLRAEDQQLQTEHIREMRAEMERILALRGGRSAQAQAAGAGSGTAAEAGMSEHGEPGGGSSEG